MADEAQETFFDVELPKRWLGDNWPQRAFRERHELSDALAKLPEVVQRIEETSGLLLSLLAQDTEPSRARLRDLLALCHDLVALDTVPESWLIPGVINGVVLPLLSRARSLSDELASTEASLFDRFEPAIVEDVSREMVLRFRLDYGGVLKRLISGEYRRDVRLIRSHLNGGGNPNHAALFATVETAVRCGQLRHEWKELIPELGAHLGARFKDRATDWDDAFKSAAILEKVLKVLDPGGVARAVLLDRDAVGRVDTLSHLLAEALDGLRALEMAILTEQALEDESPNLDQVGGLLAAWRDLHPSFVRLNAILDRLKDSFGVVPEDWLQIRAALEAGQAVIRLDGSMEADGSSLTIAFGRRFDGWSTDWSDVLAVLNWTSRLTQLLPEGPVTSLLDEHVISPRPRQEYEERGVSLRLALQTFAAACETAEELFSSERLPVQSWNVAVFSVLRDWALDLQAHADSANDWLAYRELVRELERTTAPGTIDRIRLATSDAADIPLIIKRRLLEAWLDAMSRDIPVFRQFAGIDHNEVIARFTLLDQALPVAAQTEIRRRAFAAYPKRLALTNAGELGVLRNELSKRRRQMPVRRLIQRIPALAKQLKPCFMMSPLAVSQFLPRTRDRDFFDVVVFDEASQVFPEDAVPAISRASQAIVVGDEKQLPPTSFFRRLSDDGEPNEEQDEYEEEDALQGRDSILEAMLGRALGTIAMETHLNVHYRSRHEDLIRFSNNSFYDGRLHVYPSALREEEGLGLHDQVVADAVYQDRRNLIEAQRVVDRVFELMRTRPTDESIGVVALSRTQAELIQELINSRRLVETDVDSRFAEAGSEPFFVKNLENVQGDERDHVILCIGYGQNPAGQVYQRFGPINSDLGWRRLNVAVTRARRSLTVVHSLRSEQVTSQTAGARWLRSFLEFVKAPDLWAQASSPITSQAESESDFEAAVYSVLTKRGYNVHKQVGTAGFRIDMAIMSTDASRYELGIECDGAAYHSGPAARDRDWLRQSILEGLGWCIHRVWSTDWIRNPMREVEAIESALARCRARESVQPRNLAVQVPPLPEPPDLDTELDLDESRPIFDVYETADLRGLRHGPELRYETEQTLGALLLPLLEAEGPVHIDQAIARLRPLYGIERAGEPTRIHVVDVALRLARKEVLSYQHPFLAFMGRKPRPRRHNGAFRRPIDQIAPEEVSTGLAEVSAVIQGASPDELITETARQFGYDRTGPDIQSALDLALRVLLHRGVLIRDDQGLIRPSSDFARPDVDIPRVRWRLPSFGMAVEIAKEYGLEVIDNTSTDGALWIVAGPELADSLRPLGFTFRETGGRATGNWEAWWAK